MMSPRLYGPFQFTERSIDANLQSNSAGVYALGYNRSGHFVPAYVGRADTDLKSNLKDHLAGRYQQFKFAYALSARDAYEKECELYHALTDLENQQHPTPPRGLSLRCPRCAVTE